MTCSPSLHPSVGQISPLWSRLLFQWGPLALVLGSSSIKAVQETSLLRLRISPQSPGSGDWVPLGKQTLGISRGGCALGITMNRVRHESRGLSEQAGVPYFPAQWPLKKLGLGMFSRGVFLNVCVGHGR